jgi:hypothetical protein
MSVNISAAFTKENKPNNGLVAIEPALIDDELQHERYVVVAIVKPKFYKAVADEGTRIPTVVFDHIEVVLDPDDQEVVKKFLKGRLYERTGKDMVEPDPTLFDDPDGERQVPEASGEEIMAERAEAKAQDEG